MREEIAAAVVFITRLVKGQTDMTSEQIKKFSDKLSLLMLEKYKNHWYENEPMKGQGYRCIRVNENDSIDPMLEQAAIDSGMKYGDLRLPVELTLWVDPLEVTCRFGETIGSHFSIASFNKEVAENNANSINIDSLIKKQNEARNKLMSRLRTKSPSDSCSSSTSNSCGNDSSNFEYSTKSKHHSPTYWPKYVKSRQNTHHRAKQFHPQRKFTPNTDRFHWVAKTGSEAVEAKA